MEYVIGKNRTLTQSELRKLQLIQLEMLVEVDRICKKNNISYNIVAGTLLGAVRHGGYIPWDDDADVAMLRSEYEKFRNVCRTDLDATRFYFQDHRNTKGYRWGYGKLRRKDTEFKRTGQEHMPYDSGVFIDIFPLDHVPENYLKRCIHNLHCTLIRKTLWSAVGRKTDKSKFKRGLYSIMYLIPEKRVYHHLMKFTNKHNNMPSKMVRIITFPTPNRTYGYLKKWYQHSKDTVFEGITFSGIKDHDEYLSFKFGDYMTLPPENERKTHPTSYFRF